MSTKKPWFPLYAADWMTDTAGLSIEARGAYIQILCYQWINGSIPRPPSQLSRIAGCTIPELDKLWPELEPKFEGDHVSMVNPRLERERMRAEKVSEGKRKGGQASAAARKKPNQINHQEHLLKNAGGLLDVSSENGAPHSHSQSHAHREKTPPTPPKGGKRATRLPEDWKPDDGLLAWAQQKVPMIDTAYETEKFRDYFIGKGRTYVDWRRTWQNWMRRANEGGRSGETRRLSPGERVERAAQARGRTTGS